MASGYKWEWGLDPESSQICSLQKRGIQWKAETHPPFELHLSTFMGKRELVEQTIFIRCLLSSRQALGKWTWEERLTVFEFSVFRVSFGHYNTPQREGWLCLCYWTSESSNYYNSSQLVLIIISHIYYFSTKPLHILTHFASSKHMVLKDSFCRK